jgi:cytochrome c oxidase subunit III
MNTPMRQVLDVSDLPHDTLDHRSPIWWGNLGLLMIETTMFAILVGAYFYLRLNFEQWPPPQVNYFPPTFRPVPDLRAPLVNLLVILASCAPMIWADLSALHRNRRGVDLGLVGCIVLGLAAIGLRWPEFHALKFSWDDNAYGSITWMILGMHLTHLIVGTCENALMLGWVVTHGLDDKHARDIRVSAVYWYWIVATWVLLFAIVFVGPRFS